MKLYDVLMRGDRVAFHSMKELKRGLEKLERTNIKWLMGQSPVEGMCAIPEKAFRDGYVYLCTNYYPTSGTFYLAWGTKEMLMPDKHADTAYQAILIEGMLEVLERSVLLD